MRSTTLSAGSRSTLPTGQWVLIVAAIQVATCLLVWAALPLFYPAGLSQQTGAESVRLHGSDFTAVVAASSRQEADSTVVLKMQPALRSGVQIGEAVFRTEPALRAERFSQMQIRLDGWQPGQKFFLFWRSSSAPDQQSYKELLHDPDGVSWHTLSSAERWEGDILELAIGIFGQAGPRPLRLHEVVLHPAKRAIVLDRSLWEWSRFKPWTQLSANTYAGARPDAVWQPATAASLWAGCGLFVTVICHFLLQRTGRGSPRVIVIAGLATVLIPWLALDLRWQTQLDRQLLTTQQRYGGLTQTEKHQREEDASLQAYAARLRNVLSPLRGKRLFLLNDAHIGHSYRRLRMQFHLLPLNVYNFGKQLLPPDQMRPGDYVLLLQPATAVRYSPEHDLLQDGKQQYRARLLDDHPQGRLFRLEGPELPAEARP